MTKYSNQGFICHKGGNLGDSWETNENRGRIKWCEFNKAVTDILEKIDISVDFEKNR